MVDWLEELLAAVGSREREQEDVPALRAGWVVEATPAPVSKAEVGGRRTSQTEDSGQTGDGAAFFQAGGEKPAASPRGNGGQPEGDWRLLEGVLLRNILDTPEMPQAEGRRRAERPGMERPRTEEERAEAGLAGTIELGLEGLYRRAVQASRAPVRGIPEEQAAWARRVEEPGGAAGLTVDELDRAVKRDSRRYDGGMSIF